MNKQLFLILILLLGRSAEGTAQDSALEPNTFSADTLKKTAARIDSMVAKPADTTIAEPKGGQIKTSGDTLQPKDTLAIKSVSPTAVRPDSISKTPLIVSPVVTDSSQKKAAETGAQLSETTISPPPVEDTVTAVQPTLSASQPDSTPLPAQEIQQQPSEVETLPTEPLQSISEEAKSAEGIILKQIESLTSVFSIPKIILTLIVFFLTYFAVKMTTVLLTRITKRRVYLSQALRKAIPLVSFGLWFVAVYVVIVGIFARSPLSILIVVGLFLLALGFASQRLLRDLMGGIVIVIERPFQIGDRIRIGDHYGEVTKIGLRAFHLLAAGGSIVVIPNAEVLQESVVNANPGTTERQVTTEFLVPTGIDIEAAKKMAFEAAAVSPYIYIRKPIEVQIDEAYNNELLVKLVINAYVFDARYERELRSNIIELVRKGLQQKNEPPASYGEARET